MNLICCCNICDQQQMHKQVEHMAWGDRITWRCIETNVAHAWMEMEV
jgi:hypothetical protein